MQTRHLLTQKLMIGSLFASTLFFQALPTLAQEPFGAAKFIKAMEEQRKQQNGGAYEALATALKAFQKRSSTLPPKEAAKQWLALLDQYFEAADNVRNYNEEEMQKVLVVLPAPTTWEELVLAIRARKQGEGKAAKRDRALRILAATLQGDYITLKNEVDSFQKDFPNPNFLSMLESLREALPVKDETADGQKAERVFKRIRDQIKQTTQGNQQRGGRFIGFQYGGGVALGDLASEVNVLRVSPFLKEVFTTANMPFDVPHGTKTFDIAKRVVMEQMDKLAFPQWRLAQTDDNIALYEAMERKFPPPKPAKPIEAKPNDPQQPNMGEDSGPKYNSEQRAALTFYLTNLAQKGKTPQALARIEQEGIDDQNALFEMQGYYGSFAPLKATQRKLALNLLRTVLQKNPSLFYWRALGTLAQQTQQTSALKETFLQASKRPNLHPSNRSSIENALYTAYVESDQIDEAVALLRTIRKRPKEKRDPRRYYNYNPYEDSASIPSRLAMLGAACNRPDLVAESAKYAQEDLKKESNGYSYYGDTSVIDALCKMGRGQEAEQYLWSQVTGKREQWQGFENMGQPLIKVYHTMKRYGDIVLMLDRFPYWQATDLREQDDYRSVHFYAANALSQIGRTQETTTILEYALERHLGTTMYGYREKLVDVVELLVRLRGEKANPYLDRLIQLYPSTSELIYAKALICQKAGKIKEAEPYIAPLMQAVTLQETLDPDFATAVFRLSAAYYEAVGDKKQADTSRTYERAVQIIAQAQECERAGLETRKRKQYQEAFKLAPNLIVTRAAVAQIAEVSGKAQEAEQHYQALYETLAKASPTTSKSKRNYFPYFGGMAAYYYYMNTMEGGEKGTSIAIKTQEKVYSALLAKEPKSAYAHYLLGTVRLTQEKYGDAIKLFQQATKLDDTYLPAWHSLVSIADRSPVPISDIEDISLRAFQLAPTDSENSSFSKVKDLKKLWKTVETVQNKRLPEPPDSIYVLLESKRMKEQANAQNGGTSFSGGGGWRGRGEGVPTPGQALMRHPLVSSVVSLLHYTTYPWGDNE
jgi:hypothetical protein